MANTLTNLFNFIYDSVDVVSRELVGFIPSVYKNSKADMVAKDQNVTYDIVNTQAAYDITPSNAIPALDTDTPATGTMAITKSRATKFHWTGEDEKAIGRDVKTAIQNNKFAQAFRTLSGEMEGDLGALYKHASRAYGTAGTTPFATAGDFTDASEVARILKENGAPTSDLQLVINTAAGAKIIGKQSQVHMVGAADPLRQGVLLDMAGMQIRESAQVKDHTKGTGASYQTAAATAAGATAVTLDTGTGTVLAGDVATFADEGGTKYVVGTGVTAPGTIQLAAPGAVNAIADNKAMTIGAGYAANMAFSRSAIHLLTRLPAMPEGGDQADDVMIVQDPVSGIFFQIAMYKAYRAVLIEVAVAWGVKAAKTEHIALLLG